MNKRITFLLIGIMMGILVSGGISIAKNSAIEVEQMSINYLFNGEQKTPEAGQEGFVYNGRTYVPIRFISEALGKEVAWDGEKNRISINDPADSTVPTAKTETAAADEAVKQTIRYKVKDDKIYTIDADGKKDEGRKADTLPKLSNLLEEVKYHKIEKKTNIIAGVYQSTVFLSIPCYNPDTIKFYDAQYAYNLEDDTYRFLENAPTDTARTPSYVKEQWLYVQNGETMHLYDLNTMSMYEIKTGANPKLTVYGDVVYYLYKSGDYAYLHKKKLGDTKSLILMDINWYGDIKVIDNYLYLNGGPTRPRYFTETKTEIISYPVLRVRLDGSEWKLVGLKDVFELK